MRRCTIKLLSPYRKSKCSSDCLFTALKHGSTHLHTQIHTHTHSSGWLWQSNVILSNISSRPEISGTITRTVTGDRLYYYSSKIVILEMYSQTSLLCSFKQVLPPVIKWSSIHLSVILKECLWRIGCIGHFYSLAYKNIKVPHQTTVAAGPDGCQEPGRPTPKSLHHQNLLPVRTQSRQEKNWPIFLTEVAF